MEEQERQKEIRKIDGLEKFLEERFKEKKFSNLLSVKPVPERNLAIYTTRGWMSPSSGFILENDSVAVYKEGRLKEHDLGWRSFLRYDQINLYDVNEDEIKFGVSSSDRRVEEIIITQKYSEI